MAPTKDAKKPVAKGQKKPKHRHNNRELTSGVLRWSRADQYRRKCLYRLKNAKPKKVEKPKVAITVVKKIGGAKNGGERVVLLKKNKSNYPTKVQVLKRTSHNFFKKHPRYTRKNLTPGRVLILLAGRHQGKRVVLLKVLSSGLLLVNGPFSLNTCPLRRISQRYVIATRTKVDLTGFKVPDHINDQYFKRPKKKQTKRTEGDIFAKKEEKYVPSEQRKKDQVEVDKALKACIKKHKEGPLLQRYLKSQFALKSNQYPHRIT
uniref:Large ribosomal subunit protein eL6 n=1 Tax=Culicoides sonorensis TaxID=179676 RepID=A0A336MNP6_CULSO